MGGTVYIRDLAGMARAKANRCRAAEEKGTEIGLLAPLESLS